MLIGIVSVNACVPRALGLVGEIYVIQALFAALFWGATTSLPLTTRCHGKWLSVDLETGDVWAGSSKGWRRATPAQRQEALACLA